MKLYKSPEDKIYAYEEDGSQDHLIPASFISVTTEQADKIRYTPPTPQAQAKAAILALEAQVTPRRIREHALGTDNGWLEDIESQIEALRTQL